MIHRPVGVCLMAALMLAGCSQSFEDGMRTVCEAPEHVGPEVKNPAERATALARWIDDHLKNAEVRRLFAEVGTVDRDEKVRRMQAAVARAGLGRCPLLEDWGPAPPQEPAQAAAAEPAHDAGHGRLEQAFRDALGDDVEMTREGDRVYVQPRSEDGGTRALTHEEEARLREKLGIQ